MKNIFLLPVLFLFCVTGSSQNSKYQLPERQIPVTKKEKLNQVKLVTDISPLLWSSMGLPMDERYFLDQRRVNEFPQPPKYVYPQERYKQTIYYASVEITATCNGKPISAKSKSEILTAEQKNILSAVDLGTDIQVAIKYGYKDQAKDAFGLRNNVVEGVSSVTVIPETEAEFPGGWKQLSNYFVGNVIDKIADKKASESFERAVVTFTINEDGKIADAKLSQPSANMLVDKLILEATTKMPKWNPAVNAKGEKVKQQISIPFGMGGC